MLCFFAWHDDRGGGAWLAPWLLQSVGISLMRDLFSHFPPFGSGRVICMGSFPLSISARRGFSASHSAEMRWPNLSWARSNTPRARPRKINPSSLSLLLSKFAEKRPPFDDSRRDSISTACQRFSVHISLSRFAHSRHSVDALSTLGPLSLFFSGRDFFHSASRPWRMSSSSNCRHPFFSSERRYRLLALAPQQVPVFLLLLERLP